MGKLIFLLLLITLKALVVNIAIYSIYFICCFIVINNNKIEAGILEESRTCPKPRAARVFFFIFKPRASTLFVLTVAQRRQIELFIYCIYSSI